MALFVLWSLVPQVRECVCVSTVHFSDGGIILTF